MTEDQQVAVDASVRLLRALGPNLPYPHSSSVYQSRHSLLRELRTQCGGDPLRTLYAFDPRRVALLLIGGDKTGDNRWYEKFVRLADKIYDAHLLPLKKEGLHHG